MYEELSPAEFVAQHGSDDSWQIVDVREPWEIEIASVPRCIAIPLAELPSRHAELAADQPVALLCHSGGRSAKAAEFLGGRGFSRVVNIAGGIDAWAQEVDNSLSRY